VGENEISLAFGFYQYGVLIELPGSVTDEDTIIRTVWRVENPSSADYGTKARIRWLLEGLCRYINTGGRWKELMSFIDMMRAFSAALNANFGDYKLIASYVDPDGDIEHLFAKPGCQKGVAWVEDKALMEVDLADRLDQTVRDGQDTNSQTQL
jgi:hypothetical protein